MAGARHSARIAALAAVLALGAPGGLSTSVPPQARAAASPDALKIGIADQKPQAFTDGRLRALGLGYARRSVAWDAFRSRSQVRELDAWMDATRAAGMDPLITFARSRSTRHGHLAPTASEYRRRFLRFHKRYPAVSTYSSWNEANLCGTGTCRRPELVAR